MLTVSAHSRVAVAGVFFLARKRRASLATNILCVDIPEVGFSKVGRPQPNESITRAIQLRLVSLMRRLSVRGFAGLLGPLDF